MFWLKNIYLGFSAKRCSISAESVCVWQAEALAYLASASFLAEFTACDNSVFCSKLIKDSRIANDLMHSSRAVSEDGTDTCILGNKSNVACITL